MYALGHIEPAPQVHAGGAVEIDEEDDLDLVAGFAQTHPFQPLRGKPQGAVALAMHFGVLAAEDFGVHSPGEERRKHRRRDGKERATIHDSRLG